MIFGTNMTLLDFALSRTASRDWKEGDRILVSRLDHDGGVAPWIELAADRGFEVDWIDVTEDLRLDFDDLERKLDERVRVVACVCVVECRRHDRRPRARRGARASVGALVWVDAVQYAAHEPIDVQALGCDVFIASAYKFCGPHLGVAYGRHELLESWRPYKARPAQSRPRRQAVRARHGAVRALRRLLRDDCVPRVARRHAGARGVRARARPALPREPARERDRLRAADDGGPRPDVPPEHRRRAGGRRRARLAERGYGVWAHDNWYSLGLREKLPYPQDALRVGLIHYNTADEIDAFVAELSDLTQ